MAYKTPDVYIEEVSLFPPSVAEVETAIPAFIGYTEKSLREKNDLKLTPTRITSLAEYELYFGGAEDESIDVNLKDEEQGGITITSVDSVEIPAPNYLMHYSMKMFFFNGGGACYIVSVGSYNDTIVDTGPGETKGLLDGLKQLEKEDEPTMIVFPDAINLTDVDKYYALMNASLAQCSKLQDRVSIIDLYEEDTEALRAKISANLGETKYGAAYHPWLETSLSVSFDENTVTIKNHTLVPPADSADPADPADPAVGLKGKLLSAPEIKEQNNELYNVILAEISKVSVTLPPSSAMAGVYAKVDNARGVWKAPANVSLSNVKQPTIKITNEDQESLNIDVVAGKSINAIRTFAGKGTLVWGARTLAGNDNEWRYVPVRRFFNMVEESVKKSTYWAVFEANDANTWIKIKAMIENYLIQKWRAGALQGAKPEQAFFVKVGLGVTMTAQDILEGRMNVEIGMAVVRPAEFIVLKFSHKMPEA
ncbi:MAG: phage tail sheath C-terminal domain-containing protein [Mariprofundus sp.]|nr:phage tail sheath C-terminal domain-containing protein [Mariprofundus sp.]